MRGRRRGSLLLALGYGREPVPREVSVVTALVGRFGCGNTAGPVRTVDRTCFGESWEMSDRLGLNMRV